MYKAGAMGLLGLVSLIGGPALGAPLEAYGRLPAIEGVAISSDGQYLAIASTNGEQRTVAIQRIDDKQLVAAIRAGDSKLRDLRWAGDHHVLITLSVHGELNHDPTTIVFGGGLEHLGVIDYNLATHKQSVPMDDTRYSLNVVFNVPQTRLIDGKPYAFLNSVSYGGSSFGPGSETVFKADLDQGKTLPFDYGLSSLDGWVLDEQGHVLAQTVYDPKSTKWSLEVKRAGAWRAIKTLTAPIERPELAGLGADGKSFLISDQVEGERVLRQVAPDASDWSDPVEQGDFGTIHDRATGALLAVTHTIDGGLDYHFVNAQDQTYWNAARAAYPGQTVDYVDMSADHSKLVVRVDSPTDGPAYALVDIKARSARWIGDEYVGLTAADIGQKRPIAFTAKDGLALTGYLTLPPGVSDPKALPLIVFPHGGPAARDDPGFDWWAQAMASRGYAVLQVNYRGSEGFGWKFLSAGFGEWGRKMQTDLSDGVRYLAGQGIIDPKRVCIVGGSYGGYAALAGATLDSGVYRCAASVAGPSDMPKFVKWSKAEHNVSIQRYWDRFMGAAGPDDPVLPKISPADHVDAATVPILLIHGKDDTTVPFEQSQIMADALKRAGKPVEFVVLDHEDHYLSHGDTRLQMLQAVMAFVEKNNPPG